MAVYHHDEEGATAIPTSIGAGEEAIEGEGPFGNMNRNGILYEDEEDMNSGSAR